MSAKVSSFFDTVTWACPTTSWSGAMKKRWVASPSGSSGFGATAAAAFCSAFGGFFQSDSNGVQAAMSAASTGIASRRAGRVMIRALSPARRPITRS